MNLTSHSHFEKNISVGLGLGWLPKNQALYSSMHAHKVGKNKQKVKENEEKKIYVLVFTYKSHNFAQS